MKVLIKKWESGRGRYYHGRTLKDIVKNFINSHKNLIFLNLNEFSNRYEIVLWDAQRPKGLNYYTIPKDKISK